MAQRRRKKTDLLNVSEAFPVHISRQASQLVQIINLVYSWSALKSLVMKSPARIVPKSFVAVTAKDKKKKKLIK